VAQDYAQWNLHTPLTFAQLTLSAQLTCGNGIAEKKITQPVTVHLRQGGERCKPLGRHGSHPLKKLLQEYSIEPWLRDRLPLIYVGDELAAVAGLFVCEPFKTASDERGYVINYQ
jgi:tRNA(Ile)-lysidine synthase